MSLTFNSISFSFKSELLIAVWLSQQSSGEDNNNNKVHQTEIEDKCSARVYEEEENEWVSAVNEKLSFNNTSSTILEQAGYAQSWNENHKKAASASHEKKVFHFFDEKCKTSFDFLGYSVLFLLFRIAFLNFIKLKALFWPQNLRSFPQRVDEC